MWLLAGGNGAGKKKKKAGKSVATTLGDAEIDALLTELDGPPAEPDAEPALEQQASATQAAQDMMPGTLRGAAVLSEWPQNL